MLPEFQLGICEPSSLVPSFVGFGSGNFVFVTEKKGSRGPSLQRQCVQLGDEGTTGSNSVV